MHWKSKIIFLLSLGTTAVASADCRFGSSGCEVAAFFALIDALSESPIREPDELPEPPKKSRHSYAQVDRYHFRSGHGLFLENKFNRHCADSFQAYFEDHNFPLAHFEWTPQNGKSPR